VVEYQKVVGIGKDDPSGVEYRKVEIVTHKGPLWFDANSSTFPYYSSTHTGKIAVLDNPGGTLSFYMNCDGCITTVNSIYASGDVQIPADKKLYLNGASRTRYLFYNSASDRSQIEGDFYVNGAFTASTSITSSTLYTENVIASGNLWLKPRSDSSNTTLGITNDASTAYMAVVNVYSPDETKYLQLYHDGSAGFIGVSEGKLELQSTGNYALVLDANCSGSNSIVYITNNASTAVRANLNVYSPDNTKFIQLYHDGTKGVVTTSAGDLVLGAETNIDANHANLINVATLSGTNATLSGTLSATNTDATTFIGNVSMGGHDITNCGTMTATNINVATLSGTHATISGTLTATSINGGNLIANLSVDDGVTVDGVDISAISLSNQPAPLPS